MKKPCFLSLLILSLLALLGCFQSENLVFEQFELPIKISAPGMQMEESFGLEEMTQSPALKPIEENRMHKFLLPAEIEQALGLYKKSRSPELPDMEMRVSEVGHVNMPNYRLVIVMKEALKQDKRWISVIVRTFCFDGMMMGSKRLAYWNEADGTLISGSLSPDMELTLYMPDHSPGKYQIDEFGKILPLKP